MRPIMKAVASALAVVLVAGFCSMPAKADVSFGYFYSNLSPHGTWAVSAEYGRVWRPRAVYAGWNPYYDGHWVYSDFGWTWVSDYPWGAIPYHYGTWAFEPGLGWVWVPGYVWAPSWVVFCTGPDYIGWAPVPVRYSVGVSLGFRDFEPDHFVVVPAGRFLSPRVRTVAVTGPQVKVIVNKTKIVNRINIRNNVVVNDGPDLGMVEKAHGKKINAVPIERVRRAAPGARVDREALRSKSGRGARAADPVPASTPLPGRERAAGVERSKSDRAQVDRARPAARPKQVSPRSAQQQEQQMRRGPQQVSPRSAQKQQQQMRREPQQVSPRSAQQQQQMRRGPQAERVPRRAPAQEKATVERSSGRESARSKASTPPAKKKQAPSRKPPERKKGSEGSGKGDA